jgi:hypothetical protein
MTLGSVADAEPLLVSLCLYEVNKDGKRLGNVSLPTVLGWPPRVVRALFDRAKQISDLGEKEEPQAAPLPNGEPAPTELTFT